MLSSYGVHTWTVSSLKISSIDAPNTYDTLNRQKKMLKSQMLNHKKVSEKTEMTAETYVYAFVDQTFQLLTQAKSESIFVAVLKVSDDNKLPCHNFKTDIFYINY
jgi:hypothetical protein